jgi:hypothetical protein
MKEQYATKKVWKEIYSNQRGLCDICGKKTIKLDFYRDCEDNDPHDTLLCDRCASVLRLCKDDIELLEELIGFLKFQRDRWI